VPELHGVCCVLPVGAKWPAAVGVQSPALVRLVEVEWARCARQRCRRARSAVVAGLASNACLLTLGGLILTSRALETRDHAGDCGNCAWAAWRLQRAARRCVKAWVSGLAIEGAAEVSGSGVLPPATRQRRPRARRAKEAALARS